MNLIVLLIFWSLWFLNFSARAIISPIMPILEEDFDISHTMAGALFFSFWVGNTISVFASGFISQKIGFKRPIIAGFTLMIVAFFTLRYVSSYQLFAVVVFFLGMGTGIYLPCAMPLITAVFEQKNWGKAISFHETAAGFSLLMVPIIVVWALGFSDWKLVFILLSAVCLVATVLLQALAPDPRAEKKESTPVADIVRRKEFWIITGAWICCGIASMGIYNIVPLYLVTERGFELARANTIFGISRFGGLVSMILIGFVIDRFNLTRLLMVIILGSGIFTIAIAAFHSPLLISATLLIQATVTVLFFPTGIVAIARLTKLSDRSLFTAILMSISAIFGQGLSPLILGAVADAWSFQIGILGAGIIIVLSFIPLISLKGL